MPRLSVIIPTYNRAGLVREAIESVLRQTYRDFELIVVDDGSTDNTKEVVYTLEDTRIRYIYQENRGVSGAINTGIEASQAEYIAVLASDNVLLEDGLQKCISFMEKHPEMGYCHGQVFTMDKSGHLLRSRKPRGPKVTSVGDGRKEIADLLLAERNTDYFMVRRVCFERVGLFNTELRMSEDWDMLFRLTRRYAVGHLAEPIGMVRNHDQSMTAKHNLEILKDAHAAVLESFFKDPEFNAVFGHLKKRAYFGLHCLLARQAARTGHKGTGLMHLLRAIKNSPGFLLERKGLVILVKTSGTFLPRWLRHLLTRSLIIFKLR